MHIKKKRVTNAEINSTIITEMVLVGKWGLDIKRAKISASSEGGEGEVKKICDVKIIYFSPSCTI